MSALIATTIFLSAFLLFLVQPLIAKQILPWFGGSAGVWATCLVFFQGLLLAGYAYAHALIRYLRPRRQAQVHSLLLAASLALLPVVADPSWQPQGDAEPIPRILALLSATIGLPYFLLSATGPLAQAWYVRRQGAVPWRLFALSNLGSLLALLAYPVLVEPWLATRVQAWVWSAAFAVFAALCATAAWRTAGPLGAEARPDAADDGREPPPGAGRRLLWLMLAGTGTALLLAVTNHITQNVTAMPFLWILPLSLYLLSFILCFDRAGWYRRPLFLGLAALLIPLMGWLLDALNLKLVMPVYLFGLFVLCMFCHGELARLKPSPRHLTSFYLSISAGGVLGGLAVGIAAPHLLGGYYELGYALVACALLALWLVRGLRAWVPAMFTYVVLASVWFSYEQVAAATGPGVAIASRNFYGAIRVRDYGPPDHLRTFRHGPILHGGQRMATLEARRQARTYYSPGSGLGLTMAALHERGPIKAGLVGLGVGTAAALGLPGDHLRFYELDPSVITTARRAFHYLADSPAHVETVLGDARLSLTREEAQAYDLLVIDAFSGDSIPAHLLTLEALDVYRRHLKPDGALLYHASNRHLDIGRVIGQLAAARNLAALHLPHDPGVAKDTEFLSLSDWVLVTASPALLRHPVLSAEGRPIPVRPGVAVWRDDYNSLLGIIK